MSEKYYHNLDWLILVPVLLLVGMGLLVQYSVGHVPDELRETFQPEASRFFTRQALWAALGLAAIALGSHLPFRYFEFGAYVFYAAGLVLLAVVLAMPGGRGSSRWIMIGGFGLQPSEFMKIAVIFVLARFLSGKRSDPNRIRVMVFSVLIVLIPFVLVREQPDLGTSLVFPAILLPMLYWRGLNEWILIMLLSPLISAFFTVYSEWTLGKGTYPYPLLIFLSLILIVAYRWRRRLVQSVTLILVNLAVMLIVPNLWSRLHVYQQKRILAFLKPESDILGTGWQVYQSKVAIGSGGFAGKQYLHGTQKLLAFLPERHSDFVYSVLSEELGFLGGLTVLLLFSVIIVRGLYLATKVKNRFASISAIGVCAYFAFHVAVNIGMTIGFAPVTGLPLPFISYGGSSMLVSCFLTGVLLNFSMRFYEY